jgi:hypothetical protein
MTKKPMAKGLMLKDGYRSRLYIVLASAGLLVILLGAALWIILASGSGTSANRHTSSSNASATSGTQVNTPVSPLLFGTNLGLFNSNDQVLTSSTARSLLQQMHMRIIRMPLRSSLSEATEIAAATTIKNLGAIPLVVLNGPGDVNALNIDTRMVRDMNRIFGKNTVYYEFGNEDDWHGVDAIGYTNSWNAIIPQLKRIALQGQFVGPVNYQYDRAYLITFLQNANPRPDEISWHEYTCDDSWAKSVCISHINNWATHIADARAAMVATIGTALPIMITEWNYAPNAVPNDGKINDPGFMTTWTTRALQTLAANRIFASMQYSCTNTVIALIGDNNALTTQGQIFQSEYQQIIIAGKQPAASPTVLAGQPQATPTAIVNQYSAFSFEDGSTDGWTGHGGEISAVQNSTAFAKDGRHALQVTLTNIVNGDFPYVAVGRSNLASYPVSGQTITMYLYLPTNSIQLSAKIFIMDNNYHWYSTGFTLLQAGTWNRLTYTLSPTITGEPRMLGIQFTSPANAAATSNVYIDAVSWN